MEARNRILPMIVLKNIVALPDVDTIFDVSNEKAINSLKNAIENNSTVFLLTQFAETKIPFNPKLSPVGVVASIKQVINLKGDDLRVIARGQTPARFVGDVLKEDSFEVEVEEFDYAGEDTPALEAFFRLAKEQVLQLTTLSAHTTKEWASRVCEINDVNVFANEVAHHICRREEVKQEILQERVSELRLDRLCNILNREIEVSKAEKSVSIRMKKQMDKAQRDYYLREQIIAIKEELGDGDDDAREWSEKIKKAKMPSEVEEKAKKELKRLSKMTPNTPDAAVIRTYLEWLCDLKWGVFTKDSKNLVKAKKVLDEDHFGMTKVKERILEFLAVLQLRKGKKGPILCFVGPPGVGKTSIVRSIARALNRKYVRMSLGGVRDESEIRGHRRTYVGAIPGKIAYHLKQVGCFNPVFLFDEIDKMSSDFRGDPASALLEVLDPEQNFAFSDHYLEVPIDLSNVLFVATANSLDTIPHALMDRMEIIDLTGYTEWEKLEIAKAFLVKKQIAENGLKKHTISFEDEAVLKIIENYTRESGVRQLERNIATVCRKTAVKLIGNKKFHQVCKSKNVEDFLGTPKFRKELANQKDEVGLATGLAWTAVGGSTLSVEVTLFKGKGEIILTGQLGDVMKESARTAISLVRTRAKDFGIDETVFESTDIHIHVPEGAIPKDGPSAGITLTTAVMSAFAKMPVSKDFAMTGEVTLRGKVLPVGGLKEKTLAAHRVGVKSIIVPEQNRKDINEIPQTVRKKMNIYFVSDIAEVFEHALVRK